MPPFKSLLNEFTAGKTDMECLSGALTQLASENPDAIDAALDSCLAMHQSGELSAEAYDQLRQQAASFQTQLADPTLSDLATTVVSNTTRLQPTRSIAQEDSARTVIRPQNHQTTVSDQTQTVVLDSLHGQKLKNTPEIGSMLKHRFVLVEELGHGGMGVVYKARDIRKDETNDNEPFVAIKVLTRELQKQQILVIALQRETKKAQKLAHPNIITVYDFDRDGDDVFMTMEYLEGETLSTIIKTDAGKQIDRKRALWIIEQMGRALSYAHARGIIHSDLKPGNVFVTKSDVVKVLDFGIARAVSAPDQQLQEADSFDVRDLQALTPIYASKEMLEGKEPDPRDDIYGLAVVACQLLTGRHPFNRMPATKACEARLKPMFISKLPRSIRNALTHALEFEREKRTASASQFLQELRLRPQRRKSVKRRLLEVLAFAAIVLAGVYGGNRYLLDTQPPMVLEDSASISDPNIRQKVENLLEIADVHMMVNRLMEPPGSSAFYAYQQVLELHPANKAAHDGLNRIAEHYAQKARESLQAGDSQKALLLANKGLLASPSLSELVQLRDQLANTGTE